MGTIPTYFAANTTDGSHYVHTYVNMDHSLNKTSHSSHTSNTAIYGQILVGVSIPTYFVAYTTNGSHYVHTYVNMDHSLNQTSHSSHTSKTAIYGQILVQVLYQLTLLPILLMALTMYIHM